MERFLAGLEQAIWSWPLLGLVLGTGIYLSVRLRGRPLRQLGRAMGLLLRSGGKTDGVSGFGALCTSLAATVGTGNIVGVASALALGGPGALFWMDLSALTGMAVKYAEGFLAVRYRERRPDGSLHGGPFAYIRLGLGPRWSPLAKAFALCGAAAGILGVGTFVQIGSMSAGLRYFLDRELPDLPRTELFGRTVPVLLPGLAVLLGLGTGLLIRGGIRRISRVSAVLVPGMGLLYLGGCLWILVRFGSRLPAVCGEILRGAFRPEAAAGGLLATVQAGVSRGIFSNEAGVGTSAIAAACAETEDPEEQGLIHMTSAVFDTLLICSLTGLAILVAGVNPGEAGIWSAMEAFGRGLPLPETAGRGLVLVCLFLFAFTTVVGWSWYGTECLDALTGGNARLRRSYLTVYTATVFLAPFVSVRAIWSAAGICNGLMAIPNLIAILLLSPALRLDGRGIMGKKRTDRKGRKQNGAALSGRPDRRLPQARGGRLHG